MLCLLPDLLEHARLLINNVLTNHLVKCHCIFKVVGYNIQIRESGEEYTETIEVDTEKQTELFKFLLMLTWSKAIFCTISKR